MLRINFTFCCWSIDNVYITCTFKQNCILVNYKFLLFHIYIEVAFKQGKPSECELDVLAGKISAKWQTLGIHLGIPQDVLDEIATNAKKKPYWMLLRWRDTTTSLTLYEDLYRALCHVRVGLNNVAREFCCIPGKETTDTWPFSVQFRPGCRHLFYIYMFVYI